MSPKVGVTNDVSQSLFDSRNTDLVAPTCQINLALARGYDVSIEW